MLSFGIKIISIDYRTQYKSVSNVMLDNKMGGFLATRHLIEQGHRKIGCITGPLQADSSTANQRYLGYKQALEKYQIEVNEKFVAYGEYNIESGVKHAGTPNATPNPPGAASPTISFCCRWKRRFMLRKT